MGGNVRCIQYQMQQDEECAVRCLHVIDSGHPAGWGCDAAQQQHPAASDQTHHFHIISEGDYLDTVAAQPFPLTDTGTAVVDLAWLQ